MWVLIVTELGTGTHSTALSLRGIISRVSTYKILTFDPEIVGRASPVRGGVTCLTFEPILIGRFGGEEHVGKEALERVTRISGTVFHIIANSRLQTLHKVWLRCTQLLCNKRRSQITGH